MKETDIFDKLDNVLGNYAESKASKNDVISVARKVNDYLLKHPHPHDIIDSLGLILQAGNGSSSEGGRITFKKVDCDHNYKMVGHQLNGHYECTKCKHQKDL